jgi:ribonuclease Z
MLEVYGPLGIRDFVDAIEKTVNFTLTFPLDVKDVDEGVICEEKDYRIESVWVEHSIPTLAFAFKENPLPGRFHPDLARELGVPEGVLWGKLQRGVAITLEDGRTVNPEAVVDPPRPGRRIVYTGDTRFFEGLVKFAAGTDLLIHECTFDDSLHERAVRDGHSTPSDAVKTAVRANVKHLILTHISARYKDPTLLLQQAQAGFTDVVVAKDLMVMDLPSP